VLSRPAESNQDSPVRGRGGRGGRRGGGGAAGGRGKKKEEEPVGEASDEDNSDLDLSDVDEEGKLDVRNIYECQKVCSES
jgi:hypothetical protein